MNIDNIKKNVEVDDGLILLGKPLKLSKYGKTIEITPVNWFYDWSNFVYALGVFLSYYYIVCTNAKLPDSLDELKEFESNVATAMSNKEAFNALCKVCKYSGFNTRWMKKKFTLSDWIEVFIYVYLFNIQGVKKNSKIALKALKSTQ